MQEMRSKGESDEVLKYTNKPENYTLSKLALCMVIDTAGFLLDQKIHRG